MDKNKIIFLFLFLSVISLMNLPTAKAQFPITFLYNLFGYSVITFPSNESGGGNLSCSSCDSRFAREGENATFDNVSATYYLGSGEYLENISAEDTNCSVAGSCSDVMYNPSSEQLNITINDSSPNTVVEAIRITRQTNGNGAIGIGSSIPFYAPTDDGTMQEQARIEVSTWGFSANRHRASLNFFINDVLYQAGYNMLQISGYGPFRVKNTAINVAMLSCAKATCRWEFRRSDIAQMTGIVVRGLRLSDYQSSAEDDVIEWDRRGGTIKIEDSPFDLEVLLSNSDGSSSFNVSDNTGTELVAINSNGGMLLGTDNTLDGVPDGGLNLTELIYDTLTSKSPALLRSKDSDTCMIIDFDKKTFSWCNCETGKCDDNNKEAEEKISKLKAEKEKNDRFKQDKSDCERDNKHRFTNGKCEYSEELDKKQCKERSEYHYLKNGQCLENPVLKCETQQTTSWDYVNHECFDDPIKVCIYTPLNTWNEETGRCEYNAEQDCLKDRTSYWTGTTCIGAEGLG